MKRNLIKLLAAVTVFAMLCTLLAGCGTKKEEPVAQAAMPNPMTEITAKELNMPMNVPESASDVAYFIIKTEGEEPVYQMSFTLDGHKYDYRGQSTPKLEAYDLSGIYYENWDTQIAEVSYCKGTVKTCAEAAAVVWLDVVPGIDYTLGCSEAVSAEEIVNVANAVFVSAQGDAEPDIGDADEAVANVIPLKCPESAENPVYYSDNNMSVVEFDMGGVHFVYRAQYTSELEPYDMSGISDENMRSGKFKVSYCNAGGKDNDEVSVIYWLDIVPGVNYTLTAYHDFAVEYMIQLATELFEPLQGDAYPDNGYARIYKDDNYDDVIITADGEGGYSIEIGIYRLTTFEGTATDVDGHYEFVVEGPGEGSVTGTFAPAEDGTWTLDFINSEWGLLESGTQFTGFGEVTE